MRIGQDPFNGNKCAAIADQIEQDYPTTVGVEEYNPTGLVEPAFYIDEYGNRQPIDGITKRYLAALQAFTERASENMGVDGEDGTFDAFTTLGGKFSKRYISWDPQKGILTVSDRDNTGPLTDFTVLPEDVGVLADTVYETLRWNEYNGMSAEQLAALGLRRAIWSFGDVHFEGIDLNGE